VFLFSQGIFGVFPRPVYLLFKLQNQFNAKKCGQVTKIVEKRGFIPYIKSRRQETALGNGGFPISG
jgi:hypothetical protein